MPASKLDVRFSPVARSAVAVPRMPTAADPGGRLLGALRRIARGDRAVSCPGISSHPWGLLRGVTVPGPILFRQTRPSALPLGRFFSDQVMSGGKSCNDSQ